MGFLGRVGIIVMFISCDVTVLIPAWGANCLGLGWVRVIYMAQVTALEVFWATTARFKDQNMYGGTLVLNSGTCCFKLCFRIRAKFCV